MTCPHLNWIACAALICPGLSQAVDMVTADGTLYREFKIQGVNETSLQIIHAEGTDRVAFTNLPPDMQARWLPQERPEIPERQSTEPTAAPAPLMGVNNRAGIETHTLGDHAIQLKRHYHRFYILEGVNQLFPDPLELALDDEERLYHGKNGIIAFQREKLSYMFRSSNTNVFTIDTRDRLILRGTGKAALLVSVDGAKTETALEVIELPLRLGMTSEEVTVALGKADAVKDVSVEWPDDINIDHIRYKGYLPAEKWQGIPSRASHWSWRSIPGAVVSMAEDQHGTKRLYRVSSGASMTQENRKP